MSETLLRETFTLWAGIWIGIGLCNVHDASTWLLSFSCAAGSLFWRYMFRDERPTTHPTPEEGERS